MSQISLVKRRLSRRLEVPIAQHFGRGGGRRWTGGRGARLIDHDHGDLRIARVHLLVDNSRARVRLLVGGEDALLG